MIKPEKDYVFESTAQYRRAEVRHGLDSVPKRRYLQYAALQWCPGSPWGRRREIQVTHWDLNSFAQKRGDPITLDVLTWIFGESLSPISTFLKWYV